MHVSDDELATTFRLFDRDGSGQIDDEECRNGLIALGFESVKDNDVDQIMGPHKEGEARRVDLESFVKRYREVMTISTSPEKQIETAFRMMDKHCTQSITVDDLREVGQIVDGRPLPVEELQQIVKTVSRGGDAIRYGDFCAAMKKHDAAMNRKAIAEQKRERAAAAAAEEAAKAEEAAAAPAAEEPVEAKEEEKKEETEAAPAAEEETA